MLEKDEIKLKIVKNSDIKFLYLLLKDRDSKTNISHRKMPSLKNHTKFVLSKSYSEWYIIFYKLKKIGTVYLSKQDEIGIHMKKPYDLEKIKITVLNELISKNPRTRYFVNVNPENKKEIKFFEKNGFHLIQKTFELNTNRGKIEKNEKNKII